MSKAPGDSKARSPAPGGSGVGDPGPSAAATTAAAGGPAVPALSVVVPAFNEEGLLENTILALRRSLDALRVPAEIIIVDDGSRDRTATVADRLAAGLRGVSACHQENQGLGGAFRTGADRATGDYLILWPADMPAEPADLAPYLERVGQADVIVGCRRRRLGYSALMRLNAWIYPRLVAGLFGLRLRDVNWIHAYRRSRFAGIRLTQQGIPMLVETLVRLRDAGAVFAEVDVDMRIRAQGVPSASRFRVMRRTLCGLIAFWRQWRRETHASRSSARRA